MVCGHCGNNLNIGAAFCDRCGSMIGQPVPVTSQPDARIKKPVGILLAMIGVCIAVVVAVAAFAALPLGKAEQYKKCVKAYQDYYNQERGSSGYNVAARITIDRDGLPLLWLVYIKSENKSDVVSTQVLKLDAGKIKVLAEAKNVFLSPIVADEQIAAMTDKLGTVYVYDEKNQMFKIIELPKNHDKDAAQNVLDENNIALYYYYLAENKSAQTIAYIGRGRGLRTGDLNSDSDDKFYAANGKSWAWKDAATGIRSLHNFNPDAGDVRKEIGVVTWLGERDADTMFRILQDRPAYSSEDLFMLLDASGLFQRRTDGIEFSIADDIKLHK